ncbi:MAG: 6-phosphofructokinase [Bacteroidetes bacterium 4484_249]|nr:MAG: 6-phosphofructokinase [Bacteroidetes bacterium 4484_249]
MKKSIVIIAGGGPAPGINTVIASVAKVFLKDGYRVIGLHEGYKGLFAYKPSIVEFDFLICDKIMNQGGSLLQMSRHKPKDDEFKTDFFVNNNVKLLVTIGGDDTASTANRISKFLSENNVSIQNIHVPKTIDNDLPLPEGSPTFGYQSAKETGVRIAATVYEDARTSGNWFVVSAMGREAGHLAFGIGAACHYPMIIIPEMFNKTRVSFNKIINLMISSILKRKILRIDYGAIIVSEGVFHFMTNTEIEATDINFTYDDHGHPELGNVSKAHIFNMLLQRKLKKLNINVKSIGVKILFDQGKTGCMVTSDPKGDISPLYLKDVEDENGKVKPRLVDVNCQKSELVFRNNLHFIYEKDYDAAKEFVDNPEEFDFYKILNWD